ncbi:DUF1127 domain-containing protein [Tropicimonas sediminicola]|uniref:YjiS-like domain-containing protein n=1 Tax=Tropicimonas sediminicola TaxID=1031541 RepID=A0A239GQ66_9RHOB|nr:DUF1127 domain-containing protein [Tropicimonas sediminicola]SNS71101.1 protein of unknown function [Tropicimonas sediminicola]
MAYVNTAAQVRPNGLSRWINARIAEYREAARRREVYRRTLGELQSMSERELNDLGISSASLRDLARQAAEMA